MHKSNVVPLNPKPDFLKLQGASPSIWTTNIGRARRDGLVSGF